MANEHERELPKQVGNYTLLKRLDSGASAHAYLARDNRSGDYIALRLLDEDGWGEYLSMAPERLNGIITKSGDQSLSDYTAYEFSPENHLLRPVNSSQNKNVDFKEERLEEKFPPNLVLREPIGATSFKAIAKDSKDSKDSKGHSDAIAQPPQPSPTPTEDTSDHSRQSTTKNPVETLNIRVSRKTFKDFFWLLEELNYRPREKPGDKILKVSCYDSVEVGPNEEWNIISLPDDILTKPTPEDMLAIVGLCSVFGRRAFILVFHEASRDLFNAEIEHIITSRWFTFAEVTAKLVSLKQVQNIMKLDEDSRIEITKGLFQKRSN